ncbi:hypothetical protein Aperf_G00000032797 [Anoplocephala perfoliata]
MGRNYLLPVDPSENCKRALKFYVENLHREDDLLIFFHVVEPHIRGQSTNHSDEEGHDPIPKSFQTILDAGKALTHKYLAWGREAGINVKAVVESDIKSGAAILDAAKEYNVDHIILASRGLNALGRTFLGSVSNYVVHHSRVPVTVVPCPDEEKPAKGIRRISVY